MNITLCATKCPSRKKCRRGAPEQPSDRLYSYAAFELPDGAEKCEDFLPRVLTDKPKTVE